MENQEAKKETRSEYVGLYVTPTVAKQIKEVSDNNLLKDKIIKQFFTNETSWVKEQIQEMDEINVLYRAKLLTIKDSFQKVQDTYIQEIEKMCDVPHTELQRLQNEVKTITNEMQSLKKESGSLFDSIQQISQGIKYIDCSMIERLLNAVDRYNQMSEQEKELIKMLVNGK